MQSKAWKYVKNERKKEKMKPPEWKKNFYNEGMHEFKNLKMQLYQ